jgi:hypothetical protein
VENETDELIQKLTKKRVEKIASKKIKRLHESNAFLFGLKGDAMVNFDEQVEQLWRLGKKSSIGFCAPCGIQKEVSYMFLCIVFSHLREFTQIVPPSLYISDSYNTALGSC